MICNRCNIKFSQFKCFDCPQNFCKFCSNCDTFVHSNVFPNKFIHKRIKIDNNDNNNYLKNNNDYYYLNKIKENKKNEEIKKLKNILFNLELETQKKKTNIQLLLNENNF